MPYSYFAHPESVCLSYSKHCAFSLYLSYRFFLAATCALVHAIVPSMFITSSSDTIDELTRRMHTMSERPCENGGISIVVFMLISSLITIVLSTIDFHTRLIWNASPRLNGEVRYIATILATVVMFACIYCKKSERST